MNDNFHKGFATDITLAMLFALISGFLLHLFPVDNVVKIFLVDDLFAVAGHIFVTLLKMIVVPIVFVSIVCGISNMREIHKLGGMSVMTIFLYLLTTSCAIAIALVIANILGVGQGIGMGDNVGFVVPAAPSVAEVIKNLFPDNPFKALVSGNMLQIIVFSLIFGTAVVASGEAGSRVSAGFNDFNTVITKIVLMVMSFAPIGVFCLLAGIIAKSGLAVIQELAGYFFTVITVLAIHLFITYGTLLYFFAGIKITDFIRNISSAMLFAFSVSSSNASIPVVLQTARDKLNLSDTVTSFVIPLGSTLNMDGTSIMQGVATVFIANAYGVDLGFMGYLTVIIMATIASIGTAGVPGVGLVTLAMVLTQVGLPVEGIAMIIAVDRILDMIRTAVNISGDCVVACIVDKYYASDKGATT